MKRIFLSILILAGLLVSCDPNRLEVAKTYPEGEIKAPALASMPGVNVSQANYDENGVVTFKWSPADFGMETAVNYSLFMTNPDGKDVRIASGIYNTEYEIDYKSLYNKLIGESYLALPKGATHSVPTYVTASIGNDYYVVKSQPVNVEFSIARISTGINMLYLSGDFNGNHPDRNGIEETTSGSKKYEGLVNMKSSVAANTFRFREYTYAGSNEGDYYGDNGGALAKGGNPIAATAELSYVKADLEAGTYSVETLGGSIRLCGFNGSWWFGSCPELVYNEEENAWIGTAEYQSGNFRISIHNSWGYTFGPKRIEDLICKDGSDIKIYHNNIGKPILGGDANFKLSSPGTYTFKFYYESADCTWHLAMNLAK